VTHHETQNRAAAAINGRLRLALIAACLGAAFIATGCGTSAVTGVAKDAAVAACRQAATAIGDRQARRIVDQACVAGADGNVKQLSQEAKRVARERCLAEAKRVADPVARGQVKALCPVLK